MLIDFTPVKLVEIDACERIAQWLEERFYYVRDKDRTAEGLPPDRWLTRDEVEAMYREHGQIRKDCDGHAFAAAYALADLGIKARVHLCWTEPVADAADDQIRPRYHMVCETEHGYVLDNRFIGQVLTWYSHEFCEYTRHMFSGFFEFGEIKQWHFDKEPIPPAGRER